MQINRRNFIAAIFLAPFAPKLLEQVKPVVYSFDIETVPMPTCLLVDSVTEAWELMMREKKYIRHAQNYGIGARKLRELIYESRNSGR
jgi:hypothetical protein